LTDILNMRGLDIDPARSVETDDAITIGIKRRPEPDTVCHHCYANRLAPNGARIVSYVDMQTRGKPVTLEWDRQRYLCGNCGKTTPDSHADLHDEFMMTRRLYEWIGKRGMNTTFAAISRDAGLDERTIRRVFEHWSEAKMGQLNFETPEVLGIDEVHLLDNARGVLTNVSQKTLIDLLPNRNYDTMAKRISRMPDRDRVKVLTMDMWQPYRRLCENLLPNAFPVVDKWHVLKYADIGMETIRKGLRAGLTAPQRRRLVKDRFYLLSRGTRLKPEQRLIMETWLNHFPELAAGYAAKEAFYGIYDCEDRRSAEAMFDEWRDSLTPELEASFSQLVSATKNWRDPIFNYFDRRVTNAYTEAMNGLIKIDNRNGRGYSFEVLRARVLLSREAIRQERARPDSGYGTKADWGRVGMGTFESPKVYGHDIATITRLLEGDHFFTLSTGFAG